MAGGPQAARPNRTRLRRFLTPSWEERKRILSREAWIAIAISYVVVGFALLFPQDFRNTSPAYATTAWIAFLCRTFLFHLGLLVVAVAAVAVWRRRWRMLAATVPLLLITVGPAVWSYRPKSPPAIEGEVVSVMSVNLLMVNRDTGPLIAEIERNAPDILMLQEYTAHWHDALQASLGDTYPHTVYVPRGDSFGAAIYSRRPFVGEPAANLSLGDATEPQIRAVIHIDGQDVALYNIHLLPPRTLQYTTVTRAQFADLVDQLAQEKLPIILAGDFNFTPHSAQADALAAMGLSDTLTTIGTGRGATWPVVGGLRWLPGIRLDHIYVSNELACIECQTGEGQGSDHRPVVAKIALKRDG